ncbi:phage tail tube protein [Bacillus sp. OK048]|uniref:phage tail tube protein n=1 Tax=Bacillus sp. OK048 TaxID=1882761 RepID=UPI00088EB630|nr:phage tail tube protein [Bacillus sp. OK048]SDM17396.1 Predicted secreted protein [Bacillus sp. OK048]
MTAQAALGTKILVGAASVADLTSIGGLELSADTKETTTLDSVDGYRTFMQGLKDGGEVSMSGYFNPADTTGQVALYNAFNSGALINFKILFPFGASWDFSGIVTNIKTGADLEDAVSFEGTIKVSGKPALGLTPSTGLSALTLTGTGGALTPAFNKDMPLYAFSGVTATSVTLTATGAGQTIALFVDGVFQQILTSGAASGAISIPAVGSKKLTIIANESSKAPKIYEITLVKTA